MRIKFFFIQFISKRIKKKYSEIKFIIFITFLVSISIKSIYSGFFENIDQKLKIIFGDIIISKIKSKDQNDLDETFFENFKKKKIIDNYFSSKSSILLIFINQKNLFFNIKNIHVNIDFKKFLIEGNLPNSQNSNEILISKKISQETNLKIGDTFIGSVLSEDDFFKKKFKITGIYSTYFNEFDENSIMVCDNFFDDFEKEEINLSFSINLEKNKKKEVLNFLFENLNNSFEISTKENIFNDIYTWLSIMKNNINIYYMIFIFILALNILIFGFVIFLENLKNFQIMKKIGITSTQLFFLFFRLFFINIFQTTIFSNIFSLFFLFFLKKFEIVKLDPKIYYCSILPISISFFNFLETNIIIFIILFLSLLLSFIIFRKN